MTITTAAHASQGGHFYDRDGNQILTVTGSKGQEVKPDLRHARKLQLARGVTSIIGCAYRGDLETWKIDQGIKAALRIDRERGVEHAPHWEDKDYIKEIRTASQQIAADTADEGTRIHAAVQSHFLMQPYDENYRPHVEAVVAVLQQTCGDQVWRPEVGVASRYGYGTKIDLLSDEWIVDFKSKDGDESALQKMKVYESYVMQLAAGDVAAGDYSISSGGSFSVTWRRGLVVYVSRDHPGVAVPKGVSAQEMVDGWTMFRCLLHYSQTKDKFRPDWAVPVIS